MKKIIYILFLILPINVFSQIIVAHVDTFQSFTHPVEMTTAQAMDSNLIEYTDWGVGNTYWTFNLDSKKVTQFFYSHQVVYLKKDWLYKLRPYSLKH